MSEVLRSNFEEKFPEIIEKLKSAAFIAIDSEFSGLLSDPNLSNSLFDSADERYRKLRDNLEDFLCLQIGISTFSYNRDSNSYVANSFCIYLFPRTFGPIDTIFKCQASSFEFLCHHRFDFKKVVYEGVSFLNNVQYEEAQRELREGNLFRLVGRSLSHSDEEAVQALCSQVALWLAGGNSGEGATETSLLLIVPKSSQSSQSISYVVHHELRQRFPTVWTIPENGNVKVVKVLPGERSAFEAGQNHEAEMQMSVLLSLRGFCRIFDMIAQLKKPIVGHNFLLDLMIMYKQFHEPLPKSYSKFKSSINSLFPYIYDTKFMSSEFRMKVQKKDCWEKNTADRLFHYFNWGKGRSLVPFSPAVTSNNYADDEDLKFHNAGWDSYCAGLCFIRMAHFFATLENGRLSLARPLTSTEHIALTKPLCNRVNIIRANVSYMVFDGKDPPSTRPSLLVIKSKNGRKLDVISLTERLSKHGSVDVKLICKTQALIASSNRGIAQDIIKEFNMSKDFAVGPYSWVYQLPLLSFSKWTVLCGFTLGGYLLYRVATGRVSIKVEIQNYAENVCTWRYGFSV